MSKHTPGPWRVGKWSSHSGRIDMLPVHSHDGERTVCAVWNFGEREQTEADAAMIAAAPEMLAALILAREELLCFKDDAQCDHSVNICWCGWHVAMESLDLAIAKAEGRS